MHGVDLYRQRDPIDLPGFETYDDWNWPDIRAQLAENIAPYKERWTFWEFDTEMVATWLAGWVDFVFIDAEHTYEGVRDDIIAWSPKVRPGGIIAGHDYTPERFPGVVAAVDEAFPNAITATSDLVWWVVKQ